MKNNEKLKVVPEPDAETLRLQSEYDAFCKLVSQADRENEEMEKLYEKSYALFHELIEKRGYYYLIDGVAYDLVEIGGGGWSIGVDSLIVALTGENRGKYYIADIGGGADIKGEYLGPVPRPKMPGQVIHPVRQLTPPVR